MTISELFNQIADENAWFLFVFFLIGVIDSKTACAIAAWISLFFIMGWAS